MGIPSCRFTDRTAEEFICTVCLDVAEDPLVVTDCEHIFCRKCIVNESIKKCPTCQEGFKDPKFSEMRGAIKRMYKCIVVRCLNPSCDVSLSVDDYAQHDDVCPVTYDICKVCKFKARRDIEEVKHSCSQTLKHDRDIKKSEVEIGKLRAEIDEMKLLLKRERARNDRLIINCLTFRNKFNDRSTLDRSTVDTFSDIQDYWSSHSVFKEISSFVDDYLKRNPNAVEYVNVNPVVLQCPTH